MNKHINEPHRLWGQFGLCHMVCLVRQINCNVTGLSFSILTANSTNTVYCTWCRYTMFFMHLHFLNLSFFPSPIYFLWGKKKHSVLVKYLCLSHSARSINHTSKIERAKAAKGWGGQGRGNELKGYEMNYRKNRERWAACENEKKKKTRHWPNPTLGEVERAGGRIVKESKMTVKRMK